MVIVDAYVVVTLLAVLVIASLAAVALVATAAVGLAVEHRPVRLARHQSIPTYYRRLALGH